MDTQTEDVLKPLFESYFLVSAFLVSVLCSAWKIKTLDFTFAVHGGISIICFVSDELYQWDQWVQLETDPTISA